MLAEIKLLTSKINNIKDEKDLPIARILLCFINPPQDKGFNWQEKAREFLTSIIYKIAVNEGIVSLKKDEDEEFLKEHIPLDISNTITELASIAHNDEYQKIIEKRVTSAFLITKIYEWFTWNYERRCLYGDEIFFAAAEIYDRCDRELTLWGEKDEIWLLITNFLSEYGIKSVSPFYSCKIYAEEFLFNFDKLLKYFKKEQLVKTNEVRNDPVQINLLIALKTLTMDKIIFRCKMVYLGEGERPIESTNFFERLMIERLNSLVVEEIC